VVTLIAFVVIFGTIVLFHELGHYILAKLAGIRVYEFSIGFGPALGSITWGDTKYSLRAFPLGGQALPLPVRERLAQALPEAAPARVDPRLRLA